jgi:hypothetical protein
LAEREKLVESIVGAALGKATTWGEMPGAGVVFSFDIRLAPYGDRPFRVKGSIEQAGAKVPFEGEAVIKNGPRPGRGEFSKMFVLLPKSMDVKVTPKALFRIESVAFDPASFALNDFRFY